MVNYLAGDRSFVEIIQRYNEDDCHATRSVKDWLVNFFQNEIVVNPLIL
ncbi:ribonuclease H-like domain-containing protein [Nostoc sp. FACHB-190]|nr:ribonuclease H-like domain-containing protein [Nostoc sp. FACHB-190]